MVPIDHFDAAAERRFDEPALIDEGVVVNYRELTEMSRRVAGFVASAGTGIEPVPAVLYSPNDYRVMVAMVGIMRAGGVVVPLHAGNNFDTSRNFLEQTQPRCIFYHSSLAGEVRALRNAIPSLQRFVCLDSEVQSDPSLASILTHSPLPIPDWIDCSGNRSRPVYYWATSGTSATPKAVIEDCACFDVMLRVSRARREGRFVGTTMSLAPMSHGGGPFSFSTLALGGTVLVLRTFDPRDVLEKVQRYRVSELWLSPTALTLLLDQPELTSYEVSSLRCVLLGAAGISADKLRRAVEAFGPCISHSYGQIEASFISYFDGKSLAAAAQGEHPQRLLSSGRTANVSRVAVMDADGRLLSSGGEGEIVVRGPCVKPYLDPVMTAAARRDGWHRTGDVGYVDEDGYIYVTGRIKDVVNMAGFKIPAAEVERAIEELEEIQESAVVAAFDPVRGEVVRAVVTLRPGGTFNPARIVAHCRQRLGVGKTPSIVEHWLALPRSPAGKIDKHRIRATDPEHGKEAVAQSALQRA